MRPMSAFFLTNNASGTQAPVNLKILKQNNKDVTPTVEIILENFEYKKSFKLIGENAPFSVYSSTGQLVRTYPTYQEFLKTITNLKTALTQQSYNRFLKYEILGEFKPKPKEKGEASKIIEEELGKISPSECEKTS